MWCWRLIGELGEPHSDSDQRRPPCFPAVWFEGCLVFLPPFLFLVLGMVLSLVIHTTYTVFFCCVSHFMPVLCCGFCFNLLLLVSFPLFISSKSPWSEPKLVPTSSPLFALHRQTS